MSGSLECLLVKLEQVCMCGILECLAVKLGQVLFDCISSNSAFIRLR